MSAALPVVTRKAVGGMTPTSTFLFITFPHGVKTRGRAASWGHFRPGWDTVVGVPAVLGHGCRPGTVKNLDQLQI